MVVNEYVHLFKMDTESAAIPTSPNSKLAVSAVPKEQSRTFAEGAMKQTASAGMANIVLSPLNSATGGLATPAYNLGRQVLTGGTSAAIGAGAAGLAIAAITLAVTQLQKRVAKMEAKADEMSNRDNALIRSGAKGFITEYRSSVFGVSSKKIGRNN